MNQKISGISEQLVKMLVDRTMQLSQGRNAGCFGFVNEDGIIDECTEIVSGGLSGLPLRILLNKISTMKDKSLIEGLNLLPDNTVFVVTRPGKTGLATDVSGVDFFNCPIISIGVKNEGAAGISVVYPKPEYFDLSTKSEEMNIETLASNTMDEEKEVLKTNHELSLKYLEVSEELPQVKFDLKNVDSHKGNGKKWKLPRLAVRSIDKSLAKSLVDESMKVGQGREVAAIGVIDEKGHVTGQGKLVAGGIGYVPSRLLASSFTDISGKSLKVIYSGIIPDNAIIIHTHPGGTGVMHIGDANAGPGTWGRPIIAIGHDKDGKIRGATVIEKADRIFELTDEDEVLNSKFFGAETTEEETQIRNRKFAIAQEFTDLCKPIELN
ncbi:MAG: peptidase S7 [Desulfitibacter sp. BRH_c19]|nr:MAG: peptidase S7 [Desulfitibacter sp. BRH_c19]